MNGSLSYRILSPGVEINTQKIPPEKSWWVSYVLDNNYPRNNKNDLSKLFVDCSGGHTLESSVIHTALLDDSYKNSGLS